jgi:hypothetical protein
LTGSPFPIGTAGPPTPYADIDPTHAVLTGTYDMTNDDFTIEGCIPGVGTSEGPNLWVRISDLNPGTGDGTAEVWRNRPNCTAPGGGATFTGNATAVHLAGAAGNGLPRNEANYDFDLDGCEDRAELRDVANQGGQRDPINRFDRQDVNLDGAINVPDDIIGTANAFGAVPPGHPADRNATMAGAAGSWNRSGQDGVVNITTDILGTGQQFGHNC